MPGLYTDGEIASDKGTIFDYEASAGETFAAGFERQWDTNPLALVGRNMRIFTEDMNARFGDGELVSQEAAQQEVAGRGLDLKIPRGGMSRYELDVLQYLKQREVRQNTTLARGRSTAATAAGFAGGLAASFTDPLNIASGFIPVVGELRYARWLEQAGSSALARGAVRAQAGVIEGAVGAALIEPLVYAGATGVQLDYSVADSFSNVVFGGILGGGLHVVGGAVHDRMQPPSRLRDFAGVAPEEVKRRALQDAVAAMERGEDVDVEPAFIKELGDKYGVTDREFLNRSMDLDDREVEGARQTVVMARGAEDEPGPKSFTSIIRSMGGIKVRDAQGNITREGAEILAALGDKRAPGVINNKSGKTPDYMREALTEDGWFSSRENGETDLQQLYDLLEADQRGDTPVRVGEHRGQKVRSEAAAILERAGVTDGDSIKEAAVKVAELQARELRERADPALGDADFEPMEIIWREPGEEDDLAGPVSDETYDKYEPVDPYEADRAREFEEAVAAEKSGPKDRIERAMADDAEFRQLVDEYRNEGHITAEQEMELKQADDLAMWAERRAKAFEAAAQCIEAA